MAESNPFTFGPMITDPDRFIGRRAELAIITARLTGSQPQGSASRPCSITSTSRARMKPCVTRQRTLLLCFDEFEALGGAIVQGWLDERLLGFLRNLIQHHPKIDLLLAGSHRPQELGLPWSSYLISVQVLEIAYLDPQATRRLIEQPIPGFGLHYQPDAVDQIITLTRCQPLLVQLLCQELVHLLNEVANGKRRLMTSLR